MRKIPPAAWIVLPLLAGVLYALAWPLFAPSPTLATVVPDDAIVTQRFRDAAALDRAWVGPREGGVSPLERLAEQRNVAGLPGVDRARPIHVVLLPRDERPDPSLVILPVSDAKALRARFDDPSFFLEHGRVRHPQQLAVRGDWAAISWDQDEIQRLGTGGTTAADLGETMAMAVDVPATVRFALAAPSDLPWRTILDALGFEVRPPDPDTPDAEPDVHAPRVARLSVAWKTARLWAWFSDGRLRVDLAPAPGPLADLLRDAGPSSVATATDDVPAAPQSAQAWIRTPDARARAVVVRALYDAGVKLPSPEEGLNRLLDPNQGKGLLVYASPVPGEGHVVTLAVVAPAGALPDLRPFDDALSLDAKPSGLPGARFPLLRGDLAWSGTLPDVDVRREDVGRWSVLALGASADDVVSRFELHTRTKYVRPSATEAPEPGLRLLSTFGVDGVRARALLGPALGEGGVLAALGGGRIEGEVWTDGTTIRVEARVVRLPGS